MLIGFRVFVFRDRLEYVKVVIHSKVGILKYNHVTWSLRVL